jgi:hypothetical protein
MTQVSTRNVMDVDGLPKERDVFIRDSTEVMVGFERVIRGTNGGQHWTRRSSSLVNDRPSKIIGIGETELETFAECSVRNAGPQNLNSNDYVRLTEWENWINQAMHHCYMLSKIISQIWTIKGAIEDISVLIRETLNVSLSMEKVSQIIGFLFLRDISKQLRPPEQINMRGVLRALFCDFSKPKVLERYIFSIRNQNLKTDDHCKESVKERKIDEAPWEGCYHIDTEKFPCPDNFSQLFAEN